jgi:Flp pilus assembly protein TadD
MEGYYLDDAFEGFESIAIESEQEIYFITEEMKALLKNRIPHELSSIDRAERLLQLIFSQNYLALRYLNTANLTASQTFEKKQANCLSLTIMAYALAKQAKIKINFQEVTIPEYWERYGQYNVLMSHVNLVASSRERILFNSVYNNEKLVIDFDPYLLKQKFPSKVVSKKRITAMFYTNQGAQAIVDNNYLAAYRYLKEAIKTDKSYSSAWSNLGILYRFNGHNDAAMSSYSQALKLDKVNYSALKNLSIVYENTNQRAKAIDIQNKLHQHRQSNAYYHALLGNKALIDSDYQQAIKHYKKAINLNSSEHQFYYGLARSYSLNGEINQAKSAMKKALKFNSHTEIENKYMAKLNFLRSRQDSYDKAY